MRHCMHIKYRSYWLSGDYPFIIFLEFTFWPHLSFMIEFHLQKCWKSKKKNYFFKYQVKYLVSRNTDIWIMDSLSRHCTEDEVKKWPAYRAQAEEWWAYSWVPITNQVTVQLRQATPTVPCCWNMHKLSSTEWTTELQNCSVLQDNFHH